MKKKHYRNTKNLSCEMVDAKPSDAIWTVGAGEIWVSHEAQACETCGEIFVTLGGEKHRDLDCDSECEGHVPASEGPMMNYVYPLPKDVEASDASERIADLPLCVIEFTGGERQGEIGLALTGGGMDLSWEICEAYMRLGFLPPMHFADLPAIAGRGFSARDRWIVFGCLRSCKVAEGWAKSRTQNLRNLLASRKRKAEDRGTRDHETRI
jgi:hypothetical protein